MRTHETTIGENSASVICNYQFDDEGDLDVMQVMLDGVDIVDALTLQQWAELEDKCRAAAKDDYENTRYDTAIDNHIERMTA